MKKIAVYTGFMTDTYREKINETAAAAGFAADYYDSTQGTAALEANLEEYEIIYGHIAPALLKGAKSLKWLCSDFAGIEGYLDENLWPRPDCLLSNSSGAYGPAIVEKEAANEALLGLPELSYLAINIYGTRAEVVVHEAEKKPELLEEEIPTDVVAKADGIIEHIHISSGRALFQDGDIVIR